MSIAFLARLKNIRPLDVLGPALFLALTTALFAPVLWGGKTFFHAESLYHGAPLFSYLKDALAGKVSLQWFEGVYGGHPFFAETQGEFVYLPNIILALIFSPLKALNVSYWVHMLFSGWGMYLLARECRVDRLSASFAGMALVFSGYWELSLGNVTFNHGIAWCPWLVFAFIRLLKNPKWSSALFLGIIGAMSIFSGYPHYPYAVGIYCAVYLLVRLLFSAERNALRPHAGRIALSSSLAFAMVVALSAVQIFPLLELIKYSHRSNGVNIPVIPAILEYSVRGMLFSFRYGDDYVLRSFPIQESILVTFLAFSLLLFKKGADSWGHFAATFVLLNFGFSSASPIFRVIYNYHLLPGLHFFRVMTPFFTAGLVGVALCSALAMDRWSKCPAASLWRDVRVLNCRFWLWVLFGGGWVFVLVKFHVPEVPQIHYWVFGGALVGALILQLVGKSRLIPLFFCLALCVEVAATKISPFPLTTPAILDTPASLNIIRSDYDFRDYKMINMSPEIAGFAMGNPWDSQIETKARHVVESMSGMGSLLWGVPSLIGASALPLAERMVLEPVFFEESNGIQVAPTSGQRLIDLLAVRYIFAVGEVKAPGFLPMSVPPAAAGYMYKNTNALPRFQAYPRATVTNSPADALNVLKSSQYPTLAVVKPSWVSQEEFNRVLSLQDAMPPSSHLTFNIVKAAATDYEVDIADNSSGWFFLADANYPGWRAYLDEKEAPVLSAQVLGKAVYIPAGTKKLQLKFQSMSILIGAAISILSCLLIVVIVLVRAFKRER